MTPALTPASLWRRLAAMGYDALLVFALLFFATAAYQLAQRLAVPAGETSAPATGDVVTAIEPAASGPLYSLYLLLVMFAFFAYFWSHGGQTLGMRSWRLRVESLDGGRLGLGQCAVRFTTAWISALALGLGYLWVLLDSERRSWHDMASRSRVVVLPVPPGRRRGKRG